MSQSHMEFKGNWAATDRQRTATQAIGPHRTTQQVAGWKGTSLTLKLLSNNDYKTKT